MKRLAGFTVTEVLVVVAILAALAAILFPVMSKSKREGLITEDLQKLHQCQLATALYVNDNESGGIPPFHLPLPADWLNKFNRGQTFYGTNASTWTSACGWQSTAMSPRFVVFLGYGSEEQQAYMVHGENTILLADENCNDADVDLKSQFVTKLGLGVLVDGTLVRRIHQGDVASFTFWADVLK